MIRSRIVSAAALSALLATPALAQPAPAPMTMTTPTPAQGTPMPAMPATSAKADANPSTKAFKAADDKMMTDMNRPMTGNTDQDFVAGMLPHHGGAVDMARVELQYGKDKQMRRLAHAIVAAQEKEIAQMHAWQKKHPQP